MIWYVMIWYDMIWHDMIWYDMICNATIWHNMICHEIWYDMTASYDMRHDMAWYDMMWYDLTLSVIQFFATGSTRVRAQWPYEEPITLKQLHSDLAIVKQDLSKLKVPINNSRCIVCNCHFGVGEHSGHWLFSNGFPQPHRRGWTRISLLSPVYEHATYLWRSVHPHRMHTHVLT